MTDSALMTAAQAGAELGVTSTTIRRMVESGLLEPVHKLPGPNGAYLFKRADVERAGAERLKAKALAAS